MQQNCSALPDRGSTSSPTSICCSVLQLWFFPGLKGALSKLSGQEEERSMGFGKWNSSGIQEPSFGKASGHHLTPGFLWETRSFVFPHPWSLLVLQTAVQDEFLNHILSPSTLAKHVPYHLLLVTCFPLKIATIQLPPLRHMPLRWPPCTYPSWEVLQSCCRHISVVSRNSLHSCSDRGLTAHEEKYKNGNCCNLKS